MVKIPQLLKKISLSRGHFGSFCPKQVFVKPKPKFLSNYSPHSKVLILSSALAKKSHPPQTEENRANEYLTDLKCLRETQVVTSHLIFSTAQLDSGGLLLTLLVRRMGSELSFSSVEFLYSHRRRTNVTACY